MNETDHFGGEGRADQVSRDTKICTIFYKPIPYYGKIVPAIVQHKYFCDNENDCCYHINHCNY